MDFKKRFELVKRNTSEIIGEEDLKKLMKSKKKVVVYWGTAPTGKPHVGYFFPMLKIADLLKAGFHVKILLADLHAALDNTPWEVLERRYDYYKIAISELIKSVGVDIKELEFVKGSEMQLGPEYMYDVLKMSSVVNVKDSKKAAAEVVKMGDNPKLAGLIYPLMQAVDEQYLEVDCQLGGIDQRKIMVLARENLPKIGYDSNIEIMHPLIPSLIGGKMSSSVESGKIDLLDDEETVRKKVNKADCVEGDVENGLMYFLRYVVMVMKQDGKEKFRVERPEKFGGDVEYDSYEKIEKDFASKKLHPMDLKIALAKVINGMLAKMDVRNMRKVAERAYGK